MAEISMTTEGRVLEAVTAEVLAGAMVGMTLAGAVAGITSEAATGARPGLAGVGRAAAAATAAGVIAAAAEAAKVVVAAAGVVGAVRAVSGRWFVLLAGAAAAACCRGLQAAAGVYGWSWQVCKIRGECGHLLGHAVCGWRSASGRSWTVCKECDQGG